MLSKFPSKLCDVMWKHARLVTRNCHCCRAPSSHHRRTVGLPATLTSTNNRLGTALHDSPNVATTLWSTCTCIVSCRQIVKHQFRVAMAARMISTIRMERAKLTRHVISRNAIEIDTVN